MKHRRDIEGLRALAVLAVVAYHAGVPGTDGGFVGVDVFFVISGYLITGLLLTERISTGRIALAAFYARRARRLLPISTVVLIATATTGLLVLPAPALKALGVDVLASSGFASNLVFAERGAEYLAGDTDPSAVRHFWSLAVEEQFYLVWPGLIAVVTLGTDRIHRRLGPVLAMVIAGSLTASIVLTDRAPTWAYFGLHTRAFELAIGAALAVGWHRVERLPRALRALAGWLGLGIVITSTVGMGRAGSFPGWIALVPVLATAAVIASGDENRLGPQTVLRNRPMQWAGSRSYSLYLWHWPALVLLPHLLGRGPGVGATAAAVLFAVVAAELGFRSVEDPLRRSIRLAARPLATWATAIGLLAATATTGTVVWSYRPDVRTGVVASAPSPIVLTTTDPDSARNEATTVPAPASTEPPAGAGAPDAARIPNTPASTAPTAPRTLVDTRGAAPLDAIVDAVGRVVLPDNVRPSVYQAEYDTNVLYGNGCHQYLSWTVAADCVFGDPDGTLTIGLVGDSHAAQWFSALEAIAIQQGWRMVVHTQGGCPVVDVVTWNRGASAEFVHCAAWLDDVVRSFEAEQVSVALLSQYWGLIAARTRSPIDPSDWERDLPVLFDRLRAAGIEPLLILDTPDPPDSVPSCAAARPTDLRPCEPGPPGDIEEGVRTAAAAVADTMGVGVVDPRPWLCATDPTSGSERCPITVGDVLIYRDSHHLTDTAVRWLTPVVDDAISAWISGTDAD